MRLRSSAMPLGGHVSTCIVSVLLCLSCSGTQRPSTETGTADASPSLIGVGRDLGATVVFEDRPVVSGAGESTRHEARACAEVLWCGSGGAAVVGDPVLDDQERVYVATSDGYLHAFERDGRYRFSYTVQGTPLGSVSLRTSDGVILMGTTAGLIYAINQSGSLHFKHSTPTSVWSGLYALSDHAVTFLGLDWRLYALRNSGAALYRVRAPSPPTTEPVVAPGNVVWVGMAGAVARFVAAFRLERLPLSASGAIMSPVEQIVTLGDLAVARASGQAYFIVSGQDPHPLGRADQLGSDGRRVALVENGDHARVRLLGAAESLNQPAPQSHDDLPLVVPQELASWDAGSIPVSGELTLLGDLLFVPGATGEMTIYRGKQMVCSVDVSTGPIRRAIVGPSRTYFVTSDDNGQFCAVALQIH